MIKILDSKIKNFNTALDKMLSKRKSKIQLNSVSVTKIIQDVKKNGDKAVLKYEKKIHSICKFEFVDSVKSKNIKQDDVDQKIELITMDYLKNNDKYEINLIFTNNAYITLSTEIIEVTLDDQNKID